jgi:aspartate/methionine/tyrosine aminotransferase
MYPDPGFPIYRSVIDFSGARAVPIPLYEDSGFSFSAEEVLGKITDRTRLIIVNSPANPTGGVVPKEELDKLVAGLAEHPEVAIMSDEIYARMVYDGVPHASLTAYPEIEDRLILLDGWSKTYAMTGWRLGFAVWPAKLAPIATRLAINIHSCVNAATQYAGIEALCGPQDAVDRMVAAFDQRRGVIVDRLNGLPGFRCVRPGGAFYAFPNIEGTGRTAAELQDDLLAKAGVAIVAGTSFGAEGEGYVRFSYANSIENIERAIDRIGDFLS